jgi:hypothetical protein
VTEQADESAREILSVRKLRAPKRTNEGQRGKEMKKKETKVVAPAAWRR